MTERVIDLFEAIQIDIKNGERVSKRISPRSGRGLRKLGKQVPPVWQPRQRVVQRSELEAVRLACQLTRALRIHAERGNQRGEDQRRQNHQRLRDTGDPAAKISTDEITPRAPIRRLRAQQCICICEIDVGRQRALRDAGRCCRIRIHQRSDGRKAGGQTDTRIPIVLRLTGAISIISS